MPKKRHNKVDMENIKILISKRSSVLDQLDRIETFLSSNDKTAIQVRIRKTRVDQCWTEFNQYQLELESIDPSPYNNDVRVEFEEKYYAVVEAIETFLEQSSPASADTSPSLVSNIVYSRVDNLPPITIEPFNGKFEDWLSFRDLWVSLVHSRDDIPNAVKLQRLKGVLKDEAANCIQNLATTNENYAVAWSTLTKRFENKHIIINRHLNELFNLPKCERESAKSLRNITDNTTKHIEALKALELPTDSWDAILIHLIVTTKLDLATVKAWENTLTADKIPTFKELHTFLLHRCQVLEATEQNKANSATSSSGNKLHRSNSNFQKNDKSYSHSNSRSFNAQGDASKASNLNINAFRNNQRDRNYLNNYNYLPAKCPLCKASHPIYWCQTFKDLPVSKRWETVKRLNLCNICLRSSHISKDCKSVSTCKHCGAKHNTQLCKKSTDEGTSRNDTTALSVPISDSDGTSSSKNISCISAQRQYGEDPANYDPSSILLSTAIVNVKDSHGNYIPARALLDSGSQANLISMAFFKKLGYSPQRTQSQISGIGQSTNNVSHFVNVDIASRLNSFQKSLSFFLLDSVTHPFPSVNLSFNNIPRTITLADPTYCTPGDIDLILGGEVFFEALCIGRIKLANEQILLQNTVFGWLVTGKGNKLPKNVSAVSFCHATTMFKEDLDSQLRKFWEIEDCSTTSSLTQEEMDCEDHFIKTTKRDETGRFIVSLPYKESPAILGDSRPAALKRFYSVNRKLEQDPLDKSRYHDFMTEYVELAHMVPASDDVKSTLKINYLPHHAVHKEDSSSTKLRVVFDASAKTSSGVSLNDILMAGPTIQQDLFSIQARLRTHQYVIMADITKMYRQIKLNPQDSELHRIIWWDETQASTKDYCLQTLTYGTKPASYLATRCLKQVAEDEKQRFPIASTIALNDFYMDDLQTGCDSIEDGLVIQSQMIDLLKTAGMELRKWASNSPKLLANIPESHREPLTHFHDFSTDGVLKALGLRWSPLEDTYHYSVTLFDVNQNLNKRIIISEIAKIFDPLGLIAPIVIKAKMFLQKLWLLKLSWDDSLPVNLQQEWNAYRQQLSQLNQISIPRCIIRNYPYKNLFIHGFSDASQKAYGACLYLVSEGLDGSVVSHLICAKSRVAPVKQISIPRLELCGSLLLAELFQKTVTILKLNISSYTLWTDSTIVLAWLHSKNRLKVFVGNRVSQIKQMTDVDRWKHVSTNEIPADCLSRGIDVQDLFNASLWWNGPQWLTSPKGSGDWPPETEISTDNLPESYQDEPIVSLTIQNLDYSPYFERYSSLHVFLKIFSYVFRFIHNARRRSEDRIVGPITPSEYNRILLFWVKRAQREAFAKEISDISIHQSVNNHSKLLRLNPFLDEEGIIRVGGRLAAPIEYEQRYPMVIPSKHPLTTLIFTSEHLRLLHAGPQALLASVRLKFWPLRGRDMARRTCHNCVRCFKNKPKQPVPQLMGSLPKHRVEPARPFVHSGVDFCGPFMLHQGSKRSTAKVKSYAAIFLCFATRAVHIELVSDLTSSAFLAALQRFTSRRGKVLHIYSDNGATFKGAQNELRELRELFLSEHHKQGIDQMLLKDNTVWHYIPPRAPNFGGLWEAAVKSMKTHLKRVIGDRVLTFEELYTVLVSIESCLNSRPLTLLSNDPSDPIPLTPSSFLIGEPLTRPLEPDLRPLKVNLLSRWQLLNQMSQHFWSRWSKEYLASLQSRSQWNAKSPNMKVGTVVLIKEDNLPPLHWSMGRIEEIIPGPDGIVRVVDVKTSSGIKRRSINKICPLPINDNQD